MCWNDIKLTGCKGSNIESPDKRKIRKSLSFHQISFQQIRRAMARVGKMESMVKGGKRNDSMVGVDARMGRGGVSPIIFIRPA